MRRIIPDLIIDADAEHRRQISAEITRRKAMARHQTPVIVVDDDDTMVY